VDSAIAQITHTLHERHHIQAKQDDDFTVRNLSEIAEASESATQVMTMLLLSVASISLLVGGIGIMNIMLVSVTERTREIGIRMAIGARRIHIMLQFLVEAMLLSAMGGLAGIVLGILVSKLSGRRWSRRWLWRVVLSFRRRWECSSATILRARQVCSIRSTRYATNSLFWLV
jgi:macrolide transport system ATP-binding/permease protein